MTIDFKTVGESIREKRLEAGLSQTKLEKISGLGDEVLWRIEVGCSIPIEETIWRLGASLCFRGKEVLKLLDSARYQRKHRDKFQREYALKRAQKLLNRYSL